MRSIGQAYVESMGIPDWRREFTRDSRWGHGGLGLYPENTPGTQATNGEIAH
jgi:hypothetical protein